MLMGKLSENGALFQLSMRLLRVFGDGYVSSNRQIQIEGVSSNRNCMVGPPSSQFRIVTAVCSNYRWV